MVDKIILKHLRLPVAKSILWKISLFGFIEEEADQRL